MELTGYVVTLVLQSLRRKEPMMKGRKPCADELKRRGIDPKTMLPITKTKTVRKPRKSTAAKKAEEG